MSYFVSRPHGTRLLLSILLVSVFGEAHPFAASVYADGQENLHRSPSAVEFSARLIWRRGGKTSRAQLFVQGDRYRIEHLGGVRTDLGLAGVTIVRLDIQQVWYIYSQRRLVLSVPATDTDRLPFSVKLDREVTRTLIGDAFVGKRAALLYEVEVSPPSGQRETYYEWVDVERQVLLKLLSQDRDWWVEYEHVVVSKQPDYYFEPPLGYRRIEAQEARPETG